PTSGLGSLRRRISLTVSGGHSATAAGTPNPILILSRALTEIAHLRLPVTPRTTINVGHISGGTSINSIPESATALLDLRSTDPVQLVSTATTVHQIFDEIVSLPTTNNTTIHPHNIPLETLDRKSTRLPSRHEWI